MQLQAAIAKISWNYGAHKWGRGRQQHGWLLQTLPSHLNRDRTDARVWGLTPPPFIYFLLASYSNFTDTDLPVCVRDKAAVKCVTPLHVMQPHWGTEVDPLILSLVVAKHIPTHRYTVNLVISSRPSVRPHQTESLPPDGPFRNFMLEWNCSFMTPKNELLIETITILYRSLFIRACIGYSDSFSLSVFTTEKVNPRNFLQYLFYCVLLSFM